MRLPLVVRSLGIILLSPLLTVPTSVVVGGGPVALASSPAEDPPAPVEVAPAPAPEAAAAPAPSQLEAPAEPAAVEVSVQCGREGCVVVSGLEVTIVESVH